MICLALAACAIQPTGRKDLLDFLSDGVTRRDDALLKLGEPSAKYESSRILAFRLRKDETGYVLLALRNNWHGVQYSLILVFDDQGVLRQHALVEVSPP
ncbi:hypothetical protein QU487_18115 [Crenobacter sp. SG2305]|uniref:hypothetical protein n=1 Tax=Crenobacter oryzisoli TaxID=3056844 RepID=UPI0025AAE48E|nr:hypothetical protein [Crenobacter sp. SG2305]MDN0084653.1 hypothetical protein [Crenobacter sp. SG2305]